MIPTSTNYHGERREREKTYVGHALECDDLWGTYCKGKKRCPGREAQGTSPEEVLTKTRQLDHCHRNREILLLPVSIIIVILG